MKEEYVKMLKLIYVCLSMIHSEYFERANVLQSNCLLDVALDCWQNDTHNLGQDPLDQSEAQRMP